MLKECSFHHFCVQYEFGVWNKNILRVKVGYLNEFMTHKYCAEMRILKMGVPLFKWASCMYY